MNQELPPLPPKKCIEPTCKVILPFGSGSACPEHQDEAGKLVSEFNAGVPSVPDREADSDLEELISNKGARQP